MFDNKSYCVMEKLDPIASGSKIFVNLFNEIGVDEITYSDSETLTATLNKLLSATEGWVIVDFLDCGNWDCFGSFSIDKESGLLFLNWHTYTGKNDILSFVEGQGYKPTISTLMLHFKDLKFERMKNFPFIALRGFAIKDKEAKNYFRKFDPEVKNVAHAKENFYSLYTLDRGSYVEDCYCLCTPIYTILIIPKDTAAATVDSQKILFLYNYHNCSSRIQKIKYLIQKEKNDDEDSLCGRANSIRRIFEYALKIECCHQKQLNYELFWNGDLPEDALEFNNEYSDMLLGKLVSMLRVLKNEEEIIQLNKIVRLANELSHDSGKPVTRESAIQLSESTVEYIENLMSKIKFK